MTSELTSNQYYGGLNRRFEKRAKVLRRLGWEYFPVAGLPIAVFRKSFGWKVRAIQASDLHHADKRAWMDILADNLVH